MPYMPTKEEPLCSSDLVVAVKLAPPVREPNKSSNIGK